MIRSFINNNSLLRCQIQISITKPEKSEENTTDVNKSARKMVKIGKDAL